MPPVAPSATPLDEALGLEPRRLVTLGTDERALWLATEMAYDRAAEALAYRCWPSDSSNSMVSATPIGAAEDSQPCDPRRRFATVISKKVFDSYTTAR